MNVFTIAPRKAIASSKSILLVLGNHKFIATFLCIGLATCASLASGQEPAAEIIITADSSSISGLSSSEGPVFTYEGNVVLTTETIEIRGDKAIVKVNSETNEISMAHILGSPALLEQANAARTLIKGNSEEMEYLEESSEIILRGSATLTQQGASSKCEEIIYNLNTELFEGIGGCEVRLVRSDSQNH